MDGEGFLDDFYPGGGPSGAPTGVPTGVPTSAAPSAGAEAAVVKEEVVEKEVVEEEEAVEAEVVEAYVADDPGVAVPPPGTLPDAAWYANGAALLGAVAVLVLGAAGYGSLEARANFLGQPSLEYSSGSESSLDGAGISVGAESKKSPRHPDRILVTESSMLSLSDGELTAMDEFRLQMAEMTREQDGQVGAGKGG
eukprot:CAMPEP_0194292572 /NCGR_PEP_ID=MMETSP0169-20130528/45944_1 /TAXON_ID=218684 /ORGANISM="Corethron pennatum, Strain L29A3" /LENGTH=195 /DNA_ID=CAMNT_0039040785 /DNA_START=1 /DNA_END=585 /DNA_ORIENTATION=+